LARHFGTVAGVDISPAVVQAARRRYPTLDAREADVRSLPFGDGTFAAVVSNSTLDHFDRSEDIGRAIAEIHRVLRPSGLFLITLDNPVNPIIWIRNALPRRVRAASHLASFEVGATLGPRRLRAILGDAGFTVLRIGALSHSPRVAVALGGHVVDRLGPRVQGVYVRIWSSFEGLGKLPTRFITGHYLAALARKNS
jgi:SAM-dependent methyltransferase